MNLPESFEGRVVRVDVDGDGDKVPFTGEILVETVVAGNRSRHWFNVERHTQLEYDEEFNGLRWPLVRLRHRPRVDDPVLVVLHEGHPICWAWRNTRNARVQARRWRDRLVKWSTNQGAG